MHLDLGPAELSPTLLSAFTLVMTAFAAGHARDPASPGTTPKPPYVQFPPPPK